MASGDSEGKVASGGHVVDMPVEVVEPGSANGARPDEPKTQIPPVAQVPGTSKGSENEDSVTPPHKITGAFLVGEVIPNEDGESGSVQIGIIAKQDDIRLTEQPERFGLKWQLAADETLESSIRLVPTKNAAYDRILEFDGSLEELESLGNKVSIHLSVSEDAGPTKLESIVKSTILDLFSNEDALVDE